MEKFKQSVESVKYIYCEQLGEIERERIRRGNRKISRERERIRRSKERLKRDRERIRRRNRERDRFSQLCKFVFPISCFFSSIPLISISLSLIVISADFDAFCLQEHA